MKRFTFVLALMMSLLTLNVACTDREGAGEMEREEVFENSEERMENVGEDVGEGFEDAGDEIEDTVD